MVAIIFNACRNGYPDSACQDLLNCHYVEFKLLLLLLLLLQDAQLSQRTARRAMSFEILPTAAQMYEKSHLKGLQ